MAKRPVSKAKSVQLYRHFDAKGRLLYVGISLSAASRLMQHRRRAPWYREIADIRVELFPTRLAAMRAEADAIAKENPVYNKRRPPTRSKKRLECRLTDEEIAIAGIGSHQDGGGLTLEVDAHGRRCWVFRYRRAGRRRHMGLGSAEKVSVQEAREARDRWRAVLREGHDPIDQRRGRKSVENAGFVTLSLAELADLIDLQKLRNKLGNTHAENMADKIAAGTVWKGGPRKKSA